MKRLLDIAVLVVSLPVLLPTVAVVALLVRMLLGAPVLFHQHRPGLGGQLFRMVKFRTMTDARGPDGELRPDAERLTPFGRFLRSTSLDELPELWNVAKGEMSLVGPRPLLPEYLALYSPEQKRRHEVRPGITGWAQINGRNSLNWEDKFALDLWYVDNQSFLVDLKILIVTCFEVFKRRNIDAEGAVGQSKFTGDRK